MTDSISGFRKLVEFSATNFAALSAIAFVLMVISAAILTSGYLSVFDPSLIWLIDYTDLIKVGIVVTVFLAGFLYLANNTLAPLLTLFDDNRSTRSRVISTALVVILLAISFGGLIYSDHLDGKDRLTERIASLLVVICLIFLTLRIHFLNKYGLSTVTIERTFTDISAVVIFLTFVGIMFGQYVKNSARLSEDVYLDDGVLYGATVVLVTGKFAVLYSSDNSVITVASDRVREIRKKMKPQEK